MEKKIKNKGITLIALVITIIVLIILASVSINLLLSENGLLVKSRQSAEMYEQEAVKEKLSAKLLEYQMDVTSNNIKGTIYEYLSDIEADVVYEDNQYYEVEMDDYLFQVNKETLELESLGKLTGEKPEISNTEVVIADDELSATIKVTVVPYNNGNIMVKVAGETAVYEDGTFNVVVKKNGEYRITVIEEGIKQKTSTIIQVTDIKLITIFYHGGEDVKNIPETQTKELDSDLVISTQIPQREGYIFIGWSENENDVATSKNLYLPGTTYTGEKNLNLYAIWSEDTVSIFFNSNGGTGEPKIQQKKIGTDITLQANTYTKEGYLFAGWSRYKNNTTYLYSDQAKYSEDTTMILYASWIKNIEQEPEATETIKADSLISAIRNTNKGDGYYNIEVEGNDAQVETYKVQLINLYDNVTYSEESPILGTSTLDGAMLILKYHKDLTIDTGVTIQPFNRKKGMFVCVNGQLINNGTITMTARGAKSEGQNVYLWKNQEGSYEFVPKVGVSGAEGGRAPSGYGATAGKTPNTATNRMTGGGGGGAGEYYYNTGGKGSAGTSYSGGTGGGGSACATGDNGAQNGGAGGNGRAGSSGGYKYGSGGGAGNPGGSGMQVNGGSGNKGLDGTGGLLIIYASTFENNSTISSNGSAGGSGYRTGGGGSGGGSINIFYQTIEKIGNITANGGTGGAGTRGSSECAPGGAGGAGSVTIGSIATGSFVKAED